MPVRKSCVAAILSSSALLGAVACGGADEDSLRSSESAWEAQTVHNEASNTHLWIVERALDILAKHPRHAKAAAALERLDNLGCRANWTQGLYDADYKHEYNGGRMSLSIAPTAAEIAASGATWESHFYDPDTRLNWKGRREPTAYTEILAHVFAAEYWFAHPNLLGDGLGANRAVACYEIGLALHFITDLTQPMHAANFTAVDSPVRLHTNLEEWAMEIQEEFVLDDWTAAPRGELEPFIVATARASKAAWAPTLRAIDNAYEDRCGSVGLLGVDEPHCWQVPAVRTHVGRSLRNAQNVTAQFLAIVGGFDGV
jgi:phospholipase C